jgi:catechol-2,3-dioxygenase
VHPAQGSPRLEPERRGEGEPEPASVSLHEARLAVMRLAVASSKPYRSAGEVTMLNKAPLTPYIPVADVARARKFYEQTLGLKPKEEYAGRNLST